MTRLSDTAPLDPLRKPVILVVDDDRDVLMGTARVIRLAGFDVLEARCGAEGLELAARMRPALVLLDVVLPDLDGLEVCRRLKQDPRLIDTFVVLLSGQRTQSDDQAAGLAAGADGYIARPVGNLELRARIELLLRLRRAQNALRERHALLNALVNAPVDTIALLDPEGRIQFVNESGARRLGSTPDELRGRSFFDRLPVAVAPSRKALADRVRRMGEPAHFEDTQAGLCFATSMYPVFDETGAQAWGIAIFTADITERKQVEAALVQARDNLQQANEELRLTNEELDQRVVARTHQLRALAKELMQSEERERRRIAVVLHDNLQQLLVGAKLHLAVIGARQNSKSLLAELQQVTELINESISASRELTHELSPPILEGCGLAAALQWLAKWMGEKHHLTVHVLVDATTELRDTSAKLLLFQSVRELLFNVVKHAGVKHAQIWLRPGPEHQLEIVVSDKGRGFNSTGIGTGSETNAGFGLFSIHERLQMLGGRMEVTSAPGRGSQFLLRLPLPSAGPAQP